MNTNSSTATVAETATTRSECLNCGASLSDRFCAHCGQDTETELLAVGGWLKEGAAHVGGLDSRLARTLRALVFQPGGLTLAYLNGRRQPLTHPFRLYLIVSAISIAIMTAMKVLSVDNLLQSADPELLRRLEETFGIASLSDPETRQRFDSRFSTAFPVFNLITPLGLCVALKLSNPSRLLHFHAVFSLHIASAQVALSTAMLPFLRLPPQIQMIPVLGIVAWIGVYFLIALRRVYGGSWLATLARLTVVVVTYLVLVNAITLGALLAILTTL